MKLFQSVWKNQKWSKKIDADLNSPDTAAFLQYAPEINPKSLIKEIRAVLPQVQLIGCSGSGEIAGPELHDQSAILTLCKFKTGKAQSFSVELAGNDSSQEAGKKLGNQILAANHPDLRAVFVLCDGLNVNGTELVRGLHTILPAEILISGGLAGDGVNFKSTTVLHQDEMTSNLVSALAFYGKSVSVHAGARGGWKPFGPTRKITRSRANTLFELDGRPALPLYKEYLGKSSKDLPSSGLNFPLLLGAGTEQGSRETVRTLLAINEAEGSLTFAGDMPEGEITRFMQVSDQGLIDAAEMCASKLLEQNPSKDLPCLSLVVSCVGRRIVLGHNVEEELEVVSALLPPQSIQAGFYSYGELAPGKLGVCDLHNQTMTLTWIQENT